MMKAMHTAVLASVLVHIVLLNLHYVPDISKFRDRVPVLQVELLHATPTSPPQGAEVLAQLNLNHDGNIEKESPIPATPPVSTPASAKKTASTAKEKKRVVALEKEAKALMLQVESAKKLEALSAQEAGVKTPEISEPSQVAPPLNLADVTATALEIDRLEALISKQQEAYQKRPRRKFVGARTKEYRYALYVEAWRQKVEKIGNLNYPETAKDLKLYGQLQMTVSLRSDGSIEAIELNRSSGHKVLDEAAKHIVELGAPYAKFSEDMHKEIDVLSITRTWTFTKEDSLASE